MHLGKFAVFLTFAVTSLSLGSVSDLKLECETAGISYPVKKLVAEVSPDRCRARVSFSAVQDSKELWATSFAESSSDGGDRIEIFEDLYENVFTLSAYLAGERSYVTLYATPNTVQSVEGSDPERDFYVFEASLFGLDPTRTFGGTGGRAKCKLSAISSMFIGSTGYCSDWRKRPR